MLSCRETHKRSETTYKTAHFESIMNGMKTQQLKTRAFVFLPMESNFYCLQAY